MAPAYADLTVSGPVFMFPGGEKEAAIAFPVIPCLQTLITRKKSVTLMCRSACELLFHHIRSEIPISSSPPSPSTVSLAPEQPGGERMSRIDRALSE